MKLTIALFIAFLPTTAVYAEIYNYSCKACIFPRIVSDDGYDGCDVVDGKTYPLRVDDNKNVLEWRGKKYSLTEQPKARGTFLRSHSRPQSRVPPWSPSRARRQRW
jgi:hypothetical protein